MALVNFPSPATNGQVYAVNGVTYTYDGVKWSAATVDQFVHKAGDTMTGNLTVPSLNGGPLAGFRNAIINGNFDIWQRGTSFSSPISGAYLADRWLHGLDGSGSTRTISRQAFTLGQTDVPGEPTYFLRYNQSVAGTGATVTNLQQRIEGVRTFAGQQVTISFYAKAASAITLPEVLLTQIFGTGGSPSSNLHTSVASSVAIGTTWAKYSYTATVPSISGKTLGSDVNDAIQFTTRLPLNTTFTFDIAQVQVEAGPVATPFERRPIGTELSLCQRYYSVVQPSLRVSSASTTTQTWETYLQWPVLMRISPTTTVVAGTRSNVNSVSILDIQNRGARFSVICTGVTGDVYAINELVNATAEL